MCDVGSLGFHWAIRDVHVWRTAKKQTLWKYQCEIMILVMCVCVCSYMFMISYMGVCVCAYIDASVHADSF